MFTTARKTLVAWNVLVLTLIMAVLGVLVYGFFSSQIFNSVDQELRTQASRINDRLNLLQGNLEVLYYNNPPFEDGYRIIQTNSSGQLDFSTDCPSGPIFTNCPADSMAATSKDALRAAIASGTDMRTASFRGTTYRVFTFVWPSTSQPLYVFQVSRLAEGEQNSLRQLRFFLIFGGLLGIILAGIGSLFLANRALVPIREAFSRQRQFTADASHELRTPLAIIRANAEMVTRHGDQLPADDSELVVEIIRETDHLNRLVGDLLTLARADVEKIQLATRVVDFRALVSEVHEDVRRIAESRGIESSITLNGPVSLEGDETRLRQLLLILLDNALQYTDPGGRVDVALARDNGRVRLQVADTGIGIPVEDQPRIFDRFYRVDRAREHESGGTGLGLAIARWIVQAHQGSIKVDSDVGRGTRFFVDLPTTHKG